VCANAREKQEGREGGKEEERRLMRNSWKEGGRTGRERARGKGEGETELTRER